MTFKKLRRFFSAALAFSLMLATPALAAVMGDELDSYTLHVREGTEYSHGVYWTGEDYRRENYIEYTPNGNVFPMVVYGSKLLNNGSFTSMAKLLNEEGYYVVGGINGDYYNTWDFQPLGVVIKDGRLISSDGGFSALGFRADGSAFIGTPGIVATAEFSGESYRLDGINKAREADFTLYTSDYAAKTRNDAPGWDIILSPEEDAVLTADCTLELTVEKIIESKDRCEIPEGKMLLSLPETSDDWRKGGVLSLHEGDTVKLTVECSEGWEEAENAIGSLYRLLDNGKIGANLPNGTGPRTAVGIKEDGTVVFYTVDGRNPGHSIGSAATDVAKRLLELGCVDAILMDGGGSTTMNMVLPGQSAISQINTPSDGSQRSVTNYIMLVSTEPPTQTASRLVLSPYSSRMLVGAQLPLTVKATDSVGFAAAVPESISFSSSYGDIKNGIFTAHTPGQGKIKVSSGDLTPGEADILVVSTPDSITIKDNEGTAYTSLDLEIGQSIDLNAEAMYDHLPLTAQDSCFRWSAMGDIGTVDENGLFTAGETPKDGYIIVIAGEKAARIAVHLRYPPGIYGDVFDTDWYYSSVKIMGEMGYMKGLTETEFGPQENTTRAMLVTLLHRIEGSPHAETAAGFEDVDEDSWYYDAVNWASENGLVTGYDEFTFGSGDSITREQMATLLMRYALWKGDSEESDESLERFADRDTISSWAMDAVSWCAHRGLINGITEDSFVPTGTASRAQIAVLLDRYIGG